MRRRLATWQPVKAYINTLMRQAGPTVVSAPATSCATTDTPRRRLRSLGIGHRGRGYQAVEPGAGQRTAHVIQLAWTAWTDQCDAEDVTDFYGLTRRIAREAFLAGECFVRFRPRLPQDGLDVPLQLQLLPTEQLPMWRWRRCPRAGQCRRTDRMGIEFDRNVRDRRVAYWFLRSTPPTSR